MNSLKQQKNYKPKLEWYEGVWSVDLNLKKVKIKEVHDRSI